MSRVSFDGQTFTYLFKRIFKKAENIEGELSEEEIRQYIEKKGLGNYFGNISPITGEDESYPIPLEKNGIFEDDIDTPPLLDNLKTKILEDEAVKAYLKEKFAQRRKDPANKVYTKHKFHGKRLYDLYSELFGQGPDKEKGSSSLYGQVFLIYGGFHSQDELEEAHKEELDKIKLVRRPSNKINYKGYFYSFPHFDVKEYDLDIEFCNRPQLTVTLTKFDNHYTIETYTGLGIFQNGERKIYLNLVEQNTGSKLRMTLVTGSAPESQPTFISCIQAVSPFGQVIDMESVLVKKQYAEANNSLVTDVKKFLILHRNAFRLQSPPLNLRRLTVRNVDVRELDELIGTFRVWRFDENFDIVQSKLVINEYYRTVCLTDHYNGRQHLEAYKKQYCSLSITKHLLGNSTLCITSYPIGSTEIVSTIVVKIPEREELITGGVLTLTNYQEGFPSGKALAMMKEENDGFPLKTIKKSEIEKIKNTDRNLAMLGDTLFQIRDSMYGPSRNEKSI